MIYLLGMAIGIPANLFILSILDGPDQLSTIAASSMLLATGVLFWLVTVVGDAAHGVLMFPVLKQHSERSAVGYLAARIMDATFIAVMAVDLGANTDRKRVPERRRCFLPASSQCRVQPRTSLCLRIRHDHGRSRRFDLVLRVLPVGVDSATVGGLGLIGYATLLSGSVLQVLGFNLNSIQAIPGGLWEIFIGVWLIVKGFSTSSHLPSEPTTSSTAPVETPPLVGSATGWFARKITNAINHERLAATYQTPSTTIARKAQLRPQCRSRACICCSSTIS